ncbi:MAG: DUF3566 domain-containing protein [Acidimicrobiales bacterium]
MSPDQPAVTAASNDGQGASGIDSSGTSSGIHSDLQGAVGSRATTTVTRPQPGVADDLPPRPRRNRNRDQPPSGARLPARGTTATLPATAVPATAGRRLSRKERKVLGQLRARKVRRIVRHVDPWSVLKLSLIFYFCLYVAVMVAGVILWKLAATAGTIEDVEGFIRDLGAYRTWEFRGGLIFSASALGGLVFVVAGAGLNVLVVVLFNLISDLVGGVRVTVIEEETARRSTAES